MNTAAVACHFRNLFRCIQTLFGAPIPDIGGKLTRWVRHFSQLLHRPSGRLPVLNSIPSIINRDPSSLEEITNVIHGLKSGKTSYKNGIPAEINKVHFAVLAEPLHASFRLIWEPEKCASDWNTSILLLVLQTRQGNVRELQRRIC